ncbi:MAG: type II secretion system protein [Candidatus Paceibacteria bacterium]
MYANRAFTIIELLVVVAIIGTLASVVLALVSDARLDARDKRRVADLQQLQKALELYATDNGIFPREADGANGNVAENQTFLTLIAPYISGSLLDPAGAGNPTFYYYYDGAHTCGARTYAVLFARQMDKPENANYDTFFTGTCGSVLDGEGRGGGEESYNIIIGFSGG